MIAGLDSDEFDTGILWMIVTRDGTADSFHDLAPAELRDVSATALRQAMARAFQPIIRGFMLPVSLFYLVVLIPNFLLSAFDRAVRLSALSAVTAVVALCFYRLMRRRAVGFHGLELMGAATLLLIYANCLNVLAIDFQPLNLIYFLLLCLVAGSVAITTRLIVGMALLTLATVLGSAYIMGEGVLLRFTFLTIAAGFAAIGLAVLVRGAIFGSVRDSLIADRLRERAEHQADYDALTGLPNRRHFFAAVEALLSDDERRNHGARVGIGDLDGFKPVNDLYGHAVGDDLLIEVARRIRNACPPDCLVARLGGDEFALLVAKPLSEERLLSLGEAICKTLRQPFLISGIGISISASIGFARCPESGQTVRQLYERADHALYHAKRLTRGDVVVFSAAHETEMSDVGRIEQTLRTADLPRELSLAFQPQVDITLGRTVGFEALARWESPVLGKVNPGLFIAAAERTGLIERVTSLLLEKALAAAVTWPQDVSLSFNLSALDVVSSRSIANICRIVRDSGIDPGRVTFEITETAVMTDFERARGSMNVLADMGCRMALDDFGSGYSSFAYIHRFPLHRIKTDRSFVTRLAEDDVVGHNILRAIADLCANLGLECLSEGVETEDERRVVQSAGIRYVQGYLCGKPMCAVEAAGRLARERADSEGREEPLAV